MRENPHVRFDEGAGAPRHSGCSALLYKKIIMTICVAGGLTAYATVKVEEAFQRSATEAMIRAVDKADMAWAVVAKVKDGSIVAAAECGNVTNERLPLAATKRFEPGTLLSPITAAIAIDIGIASSNTIICTGSDKALYEAFKLPKDGCLTNELSLAEAIASSSNAAISRLGLIVGADKLYAGYCSFGLPVLNYKGWNLKQRARIPQGQGIWVSAIDIAACYAIIANHGCSPNGRRVISKSAAAQVTGMLVDAVENGTGMNAKIDGLRAAGKTGTVHALSDGRYDLNSYIGSFAGFFPVDRPEYVVVVCVGSQKVDGASVHQGGGKAATAFKAIAEEIIYRK